MERKTVNLDFCGLGVRQVKTDHVLFQLLQERFDVRLTTSPDFLIYSDHGQVHRMYTCKKVYFTEGANPPNFRECDYALTPQSVDDPRHLRISSLNSPEEKARILDFFEKIFSDATPPVAARRRVLGRWLWVKQNEPQPPRT